MWRRLLATPNDSAMLVLRLALAIMIFPHGAQKVLGWFGGYGFDGTMGFLTQMFPAPLAVMAIAAEFLGSILLALGLLTRVAAFGIGVNMVVAALTVHLPNGFFMNWSGQQQGEGIEFFILAAGMALALLIRGGGRWSLDRAIVGQSDRQREHVDVRYQPTRASQ